MKRMLILLGASAVLALTLMAQMMCHDEPICTPAGGCRWVTVCNPPGAPMPRPPMCHDEPICTPAGGCRWVTVCN
jgi:hypothetical protein